MRPFDSGQDARTKLVETPLVENVLDTRDARDGFFAGPWWHACPLHCAIRSAARSLVITGLPPAPSGYEYRSFKPDAAAACLTNNSCVCGSQRFLELRVSDGGRPAGQCPVEVRHDGFRASSAGPVRPGFDGFAQLAQAFGPDQSHHPPPAAPHPVSRRRSCLRLLSRCSSRDDSDFHLLISCICVRTGCVPPAAEWTGHFNRREGGCDAGQA